MTFIQPNKNGIRLQIILGSLVFAVLMGTMWLIVAYNATVNLNHNIAAEKTLLDGVGAENTALNNTIIATLGGNRLPALAAQDNLVEEKSPHYVVLNKQWPIASQQ
jgi:hypothetical protein